MNEVQGSTLYSIDFAVNTSEEKVVKSVDQLLENAQSFCISVAFIKDNGITILINRLDDLAKRNIPGKILTTDYLLFTEPKALDRLLAYKNIELRMYRSGYEISEEGKPIGFHTKGYFSKKNDEYTIIIGSSNMTAVALSTNHEWNTKISAQSYQGYVKKVFDEFERLWESEATVSYEVYKDEYEALYQENRQIRDLLSLGQEKINAKWGNSKLIPNSMQTQVILGVENLIADGESRGLLISATGTGKTYASAFAMRKVKPKRVLFLVHREQIARQALYSFARVLGKDYTYGIISGMAKDTEADYVFATMQTMGKEHILEEFPRDHFDIIIIDEAHRSGANSYIRIMDYFTPKFWMGMTASPERLDGFDVYELFHHNIIHEIRLQQALESNLLCPFHYFGISMVEINYQPVEGEAEDEFLRWSVPTQAKHVIDKLKH